MKLLKLNAKLSSTKVNLKFKGGVELKRITLFILFSIVAFLTSFAQEKKIGDATDGSNSHPVHLIKLYDYDGLPITPNDEKFLPFSTQNSCGGKCHSYDIISQGFHFNLHKGDSTSTIGEPWIYSDASTLTNLPLSYRNWKGTFNPNSVGLSPLKFLQRFGPYYPGGDIGETDSLQFPENFFRWEVSGKLEVNCLICHDRDPHYDLAEYAANIRKENFKWAASASSSLTEFKGNASSMPDNYDEFNSTTTMALDSRTTKSPEIEYKKSSFNNDNKVFFNISKSVPNERCYFCHSTNVVDAQFGNEWLKNKDVHITSGLSCVDCHRNGLDHNIIKGSEKGAKDSSAYQYTCEGCHTKQNNSGNLGAPIPAHKGIPLVHFKKLECTVCHSISNVTTKAKLLKASKSHFMGMHGSTKNDDQFPHIQTGIIVENTSGKLEPRNLLWPSFWGIENDGKVKPLSINVVEKQIRPMLGIDTIANHGKWPSIKDSLFIIISDSVKTLNKLEGNVVLVTGGKIIRNNGNLVYSENSKYGNAYTWPKAHNVLPAPKALGANGCEDCHSLSSNFFDLQVNVESAYKSKNEFVSVANYSNLNSLYQKLFSFTFIFRPIFKGLLIVIGIILLILFISFSNKLISNFSEKNSGSKE